MCINKLIINGTRENIDKFPKNLKLNRYIPYPESLDNDELEEWCLENWGVIDEIKKVNYTIKNEKLII